MPVLRSSQSERHICSESSFMLLKITSREGKKNIYIKFCNFDIAIEILQNNSLWPFFLLALIWIQWTTQMKYQSYSNFQIRHYFRHLFITIFNNIQFRNELKIYIIFYFLLSLECLLYMKKNCNVHILYYQRPRYKEKKNH